MPLLQDGQDPEGLAARVAYHLHRLGIDLTMLARMGGLTYDLARKLRNGSLQINDDFVSKLAGALSLTANELTRPLSQQEHEGWTFYRVASRHAVTVWARVAAANTAAKIPQRQLAEVLDIPQRTVSKLLTGKTATPTLQYDQAMRLAAVMKLPQGANAFVLDLPESEETPARA